MAQWIRQNLGLESVRNDSINIDIIIKDSVGVDIPAALITSARCQVRQSRSSAIVYEFTTANGKMTITDGNINLAEDPINTNTEGGAYTYDIEFTLSTGLVVSAIAGQWSVIDDITHD